jgi:uncharacterized protein with NAD-binding domain and iron-sulfur cluster
MGWRLGGKGASGRGPANRIEEHGLHLWMGFYENAFRLMRECYAERHAAFPACRFSDWREAFKPAPHVGVADRTDEGWSFWIANFPPGRGEPGDPVDSGPFTVTAYLRQSIMLIGELLRSSGASSATPREAETRSVGLDSLTSAIDRLLRYGELATVAAISEACGILAEGIETFVPQMFSDAASLPARLLDSLASAARSQINRRVEEDRELRRVWQVIDLILAIVRGSVRWGLAFDPRGFDAINDYDWREWLRMNGAAEQSLDSGFMRGIYDLAFAFEDGDPTRPRLAAGVALRGAMRMFFTYRGALFWRMSAGMGDIVFAPLYQVLRERGVRFEFFHRLRNVGLSAAGSGEPAYVERLEFDVQTRVIGGGEYQPLIDVNGIPSWPSLPDYAQLVNGRALERQGRDFEKVWEERRSGTKTLLVQRDFDFVVLGVSIGALPGVAGELIEREPRWRDMVRHVKTVPTQAFQVWIRKSASQLGWNYPQTNLAGFVEPFDTWADMTHLIPEESGQGQVNSIAYFCSPLPDPAPNGAPVTRRLSHRQHEVVRDNSVRFLKNDVASLWPRCKRSDGEFDWSALVAPDSRRRSKNAGVEQFDTQFWTANVNPTDRYVQSLPGSIVYRISPLDMTFDNLTIAGDWTATSLDTGCIESAVISGCLAAHAISQKPALKDIVGYDHP